MHNFSRLGQHRHTVPDRGMPKHGLNTKTNNRLELYNTLANWNTVAENTTDVFWSHTYGLDPRLLSLQ